MKIQNDMIRDFVSNLGFKDTLKIIKQNSLCCYLSDGMHTIKIMQIFTDLVIYIDNQKYGTYYKKNNDWVIGTNFLN